MSVQLEYMLYYNNPGPKFTTKDDLLRWMIDNKMCDEINISIDESYLLLTKKDGTPISISIFCFGEKNIYYYTNKKNIVVYNNLNIKLTCTHNDYRGKKFNFILQLFVILYGLMVGCIAVSTINTNKYTDKHLTQIGLMGIPENYKSAINLKLAYEDEASFKSANNEKKLDIIYAKIRNNKNPILDENIPSYYFNYIESIIDMLSPLKIIEDSEKETQRLIDYKKAVDNGIKLDHEINIGNIDPKECLFKLENKMEYFKKLGTYILEWIYSRNININSDHIFNESNSHNWRDIYKKALQYSKTVTKKPSSSEYKYIKYKIKYLNLLKNS